MNNAIPMVVVQPIQKTSNHINNFIINNPQIEIKQSNLPGGQFGPFTGVTYIRN